MHHYFLKLFSIAETLTNADVPRLITGMIVSSVLTGVGIIRTLATTPVPVEDIEWWKFLLNQGTPLFILVGGGVWALYFAHKLFDRAFSKQDGLITVWAKAQVIRAENDRDQLKLLQAVGQREQERLRVMERMVDVSADTVKHLESALHRFTGRHSDS